MVNDEYSIPKKILKIKAAIKEASNMHADAACARREKLLKRSIDCEEYDLLLVDAERHAVATVMALEMEQLKNELREEFQLGEESLEFNANVQKMHIKKTSRGFDLIEFVDHYGAACSLQKSSLATEDCIWLGTNTNRMHLTQEQVSQLLPELQSFVETGELGSGYPDYDAYPDDDGGVE